MAIYELLFEQILFLWISPNMALWEATHGKDNRQQKHTIPPIGSLWNCFAHFFAVRRNEAFLGYPS